MRRTLDILLLTMLVFATPAIAQTQPKEAGQQTSSAEAAQSVTEERPILKLNLLILDGSTDHKHLQALKDDHSLAAVAAHLDAMGVPYERSEGKLDTATLSPEVMRRIRALPPGEPFLTPNGGKFIISEIVGTEAATPPVD